jgi:hypothetical protein
MKKSLVIITPVIFLIAAGFILAAQEGAAERAVVSFSNPAKPGTVEVDLNDGSITVRGYEGKDVIVEARWREMLLKKEDRGLPAALEEAELDEEELAKKKAQADKSKGMKMLQVESTGLTVEEEENVVRVEVDEGKRAVDLVIQVPFSTSLRLDSSDGDMTVERVDGEIEVDGSDGSITLNNVSGPVVADSSDGGIKAVFGKVTPGKPMSFSTMEGDIDITLPLDAKVSLKLKSEEGKVFTDFDFTLTPTQQKSVQDERKEGGGYRASFEKVSMGLINGGGVEIQLTTYEGDIYIRKAK